MKKHKIIFNINDIISYKDYKSIIDELTLWYEKEIKSIKLQYNKLLKKKEYNLSFDIMLDHKKIIIELIKKLVHKFNLKDLKIGIYLSNSFARGTNLIDSDIDLNFMYEDCVNGRKYEELICNALTMIVSKYRDFVHDSISHRLPNKDIFVDEDDEVELEINFLDKTIRNKITPGNEKMMLKLYNSYKDINSFIKYYTERINSNNIDEWIYFQSEIYSSNDYLNTLFSYIKELEKKTAIYKFNNYKNYLNKELLNELSRLEKFNSNDMAEFKKYFKNNMFKYIFGTLIVLKKKRIINDSFDDFFNVKDLLELLNFKETKDKIYEYIGNVMLFNYICDLYGIEFRTRYSQEISLSFDEFYKKKMQLKEGYLSHFKKLASNLLNSLKKELDLIVDEKYIFRNFDPFTEQINIKNYSPLSAINNISSVYQKDPFLLPFIKCNNRIIPIHPDTLDDLKISREDVYFYKLVYPTSSFRTVYESEENICYKLPVLRQITRSIRSLSNKEMKRSEIASKELKKYPHPNFYFLEEECIYGEKEIENFIIRKMPNKKIYPWFYCIASKNFSKKFMLKCINNMISIWMYYASLGIYFESAHTQNFLVDNNANIYYRDLSDIRILKYDIMKPSYLNKLKNLKELHSIFFDRSMCCQNIEHFISYCDDITLEDINEIKQLIRNEIDKYKIEFPDYSMNYDKNREGHHPIKTELVRLRSAD